jgi:hypothetical protein
MLIPCSEAVRKSFHKLKLIAIFFVPYQERGSGYKLFMQMIFTIYIRQADLIKKICGY